MIVTIDGPSGTGKSTIARLLAKKLGFSFFDTGALYRAFAWWYMNGDPSRRTVSESLESFLFSIKDGPEGKQYFVSGINVTEPIRDKKITEMASKIAALRDVREAFLPIQREYGRKQDSVFEGRDIGTVIFPEAEIKIFLTATPEVRACRRYKEMKEKNPNLTADKAEIMAALIERDDQDSNREISPLKCPEEALVLDTSNLTVPDILETLYKHVLSKKT